MLQRQQIIELLHQLNDALRQEGQLGEVGMVGGAVMCVVYHARPATRDIDGVFEPTKVIRRAVARIARQHDLPEDWLNDAAKGFLHGNFVRQSVLELSHLRVWAPEPQYMLAMKCVSARWDSYDRDDVAFLIDHLGLHDVQQAFDILQGFFPQHRIPPKTQFFLEELFARRCT